MKSHQEHTQGQIVFIGSKKRGQPVLVRWTPHGEELSLLDAVKASGEERPLVLGTADATREDVEKFGARNKASWLHGGWFSKTDEFLMSTLAFDAEAMESVHRRATRSRSTKPVSTRTGKRRTATNANASKQRAA